MSGLGVPTAGIAGTNLALRSCYDVPCNGSQGPSSQALLLSYWRGKRWAWGPGWCVWGEVPAGVIDWAVAALEEEEGGEGLQKGELRVPAPPIFVLCPLSQETESMGWRKSSTVLGLLDIYGFEVFQHNRCVSGRLQLLP